MTTVHTVRRRGRPQVILALVACGIVVAVAAGCAKPAGNSDKSGLTGVNAGSSQGLGQVGGTGNSQPTTDSGNTTSSSPTAKPTTSKTTSAPSGPTVVSFKAIQQPLCGIVGTASAPFHQDPQDIIVAWSVMLATSVELYMDGGLYNTYGPVGSQQLYFACETTPKQTHTYKLVTKGGGPSVSKSFSVTIDNNPSS